MTEYQLAAMSRVGEHGEPIFRSGRVVETIDVDVPGHNRAGSYDVMATCQDCDGAGRAAPVATGETS